MRKLLIKWSWSLTKLLVIKINRRTKMKYLHTRNDIYNEMDNPDISMSQLKDMLLARVYKPKEKMCKHRKEIRKIYEKYNVGQALLTSNGDSQRYWKLKEECIRGCPNSFYKPKEECYHTRLATTQPTEEKEEIRSDYKRLEEKEKPKCGCGLCEECYSTPLKTKPEKEALADKTKEDLVSDCCGADFDAFGRTDENGNPAEVCNKCHKACDVHWGEVDKPKDLTHCTGCTDPRSEGTHQGDSIEHWNEIHSSPCYICESCPCVCGEEKGHVSNCCNSTVIVSNGWEGTNFYICTACSQPCDVISKTPPPVSEDKTVEKKVKPNKLDTLINLIEDISLHAYYLGMTGDDKYDRKLAQAKTRAFKIIHSLRDLTKMENK
jgi:hypothetical protein